MNNAELRSALLSITALSSDYCAMLENAREMEKDEFVAGVLGLLPRIYFEFSDLSADEHMSEPGYGYFQ